MIEQLHGYVILNSGPSAPRGATPLGRVVDADPATTSAAPPPTTLLAPTTTAFRRAIPVPTTRSAPSPVASPPAPVVTTPPFSATEANAKLCGQIEYADQAVVAGNFVAGGLRLASGISNYGDAADPALVQPARAMLASGRAGDSDGYVSARAQATATCAQLGRPITVGGVQCVTAPCPPTT